MGKDVGFYMFIRKLVTTQNLRDLLANQEMNEQVTSLFQQAFDAVATTRHSIWQNHCANL